MPLPEAFSALGDATRFAIVDRLLREGEMSAGKICADVAVSPPAVSRHLKVLCDAGILIRRVDRQRRLYAPNPEAMRDIAQWTLSYRKFWETSLDRLQLALDRRQRDG